MWGVNWGVNWGLFKKKDIVYEFEIRGMQWRGGEKEERKKERKKERK